MSNCTTENCIFADFCKFTEENYDPQTCIIGAEIGRRVKVKLDEESSREARAALEAAKAAAKTEAKPAPAKKGGAKK